MKDEKKLLVLLKLPREGLMYIAMPMLRRSPPFVVLGHGRFHALNFASRNVSVRYEITLHTLSTVITPPEECHHYSVLSTNAKLMRSTMTIEDPKSVLLQSVSPFNPLY